ncbi:MAG: ATP-binding protein [Planctomycetes bacterium]|nr:ATP-binding protein [Planctomycetota bacterium]
MSNGTSQSSLPARTLHITSDTTHLATIRESVAGAAAWMGFVEPTVSQIVLAVDEAIANVIKHGYQGCPGQPIEVTVEPITRSGRRGLQVTVCDCGRQVAPDAIVGRCLEDVRPGGLGTHIIRNVMDEVEYSHRRPRGMKLRMAKLIDTGRDETPTDREPGEGSSDG